MEFFAAFSFTPDEDEDVYPDLLSELTMINGVNYDEAESEHSLKSEEITPFAKALELLQAKSDEFNWTIKLNNFDNYLLSFTGMPVSGEYRLLFDEYFGKFDRRSIANLQKDLLDAGLSSSKAKLLVEIFEELKVLRPYLKNADSNSR